MARNDLTIRVQRSAACPILSMRRSIPGSAVSSRSISAWPTTTESGLLSSCATPARSSPRADSFSFWKIVSRCAASSARIASSWLRSIRLATMTSSPRCSISRAEIAAGNRAAVAASRRDRHRLDPAVRHQRGQEIRPVLGAGEQVVDRPDRADEVGRRGRAVHHLTVGEPRHQQRRRAGLEHLAQHRVGLALLRRQAPARGHVAQRQREAAAVRRRHRRRDHGSAGRLEIERLAVRGGIQALLGEHQTLRGGRVDHLARDSLAHQEREARRRHQERRDRRGHLAEARVAQDQPAALVEEREALGQGLDRLGEERVRPALGRHQRRGLSCVR
jgi:hypothetical protein